MRRFIPQVFSGLRARLVVGFLLAVAIALTLMFATLPRLLDGYFAQQSTDDLQLRAGQVRAFVSRELANYVFGGGAAPRPILMPTDQPVIADDVRQTLSPDSAFMTQLLPIARADISISIAIDAEHPDQIAYSVVAPFSDERAESGQQREPISADAVFQIPDQFWSQSQAGAPLRLVTVTLSDPFTYRAQTLETIVGVMGIAGVIALVAAVITSIFIADRISNPIRRLTGAARQLSEGQLDTRVPPPGNSREMGELTAAFNSMAERVQASIEFIRRDRDRSRDFLADVSHELRTPIAALRTFNELLTEGQVKDEATRREFLEQTRQQIERLDWLAANLLELSKLDSGLVLLDLRPDDLRTVIESAVAQAQPSATRKGVQIIAELPDEPLRQNHDPLRLGQVIGNLLGNAIKFTPAGGEVHIALEPAGDGVEIHVSDTGVGIKATELPFVFERFYRGADVGESRSSGSGLGLSIVRSIVEMHSGQVSISSAPGTGTEVTVSLPREITPSDVAVSSPAAVHA